MLPMAKLNKGRDREPGGVANRETVNDQILHDISATV